MTRPPWRLVANVALPALAIVTIAGGAVTFALVRQSAPTLRDRTLASVEVTAAEAEAVLPTAEAIGALAQGDAEAAPAVLDARPDTVIPDSVTPAACAPLYFGVAATTSTAERWVESRTADSILGVDATALVLANRATARSAFAEIGELYTECGHVDLKTTDTIIGRGDDSVIQSFTNQDSMPAYRLDQRFSSFEQEDVRQGYYGVTRYYLVGNAIFAFSYWFDAPTGAPDWADDEVEAFEGRLSELLFQ